MARMNEDEDSQDGLMSHALSMPVFVDIYDDSLILDYRFGCQGHPGSMSLSIQASHESGFKFTIMRLGPGRHGSSRGFIEIPFDSVDYLRECLLYGQKIDKHWGTDPYWWRCQEGCTGHKYSDGPPYKVCVKCEQVRKETDLATDRWLADNPPPMPNTSNLPSRTTSRTVTREDLTGLVQVHADGGKCHGNPLDGRGQCSMCKIYPDIQSTEMWTPEAFKKKGKKK